MSSNEKTPSKTINYQQLCEEAFHTLFGLYQKNLNVDPLDFASESEMLAYEHDVKRVIENTGFLVDMLAGWAIKHKAQEAIDKANTIDGEGVTLSDFFENPTMLHNHPHHARLLLIAMLQNQLWGEELEGFSEKIAKAIAGVEEGEKVSLFSKQSTTQKASKKHHAHHRIKKIRLKAIEYAYFLSGSLQITLEASFEEVADKFGISLSILKDWNKAKKAMLPKAYHNPNTLSQLREKAKASGKLYAICEKEGDLEQMDMVLTALRLQPTFIEDAIKEFKILNSTKG